MLLKSIQVFGHHRGHTQTKMFSIMSKKEDIARFVCTSSYDSHYVINSTIYNVVACDDNALRPLYWVSFLWLSDLPNQDRLYSRYQSFTYSAFYPSGSRDAPPFLPLGSIANLTIMFSWSVLNLIYCKGETPVIPIP